LPTHALAADFTDEQCMSCHGDATKVKKIFDAKQLTDTVHEDNSCVDCHAGIKVLDHEKKLPKVDCAECHDDAAVGFASSVHGQAKVTDEELIPSCVACHGTHRIMDKKDKESRVNRANLSETCGSCHSNKKLMVPLRRRGVDPVADYKRGSHFQALSKKTDKKPATCIDCHGGHEILPPGDLKSKVNKLRIPETCGKCHEKERDEYLKSTHWLSLKIGGNYEMPVCNDCHGEHNAMVLGKRDKEIPAALAASEFCANCHANTVLMERFGLDAKRFSTYMKTYHGMAVTRGSAKAASCTSCHSAHAIRSQNDPLSTTHKDNLEKTCGECHKNTNSNFVQISVHPKDQRERNPIAYFVRVIYIWLIALTLGGMMIHNLIILAYFMRNRPHEKHDRPTVTRFSRFQVIQHLLLLVSFTVLAITGFALKFPDALWVNLLTYFGLDENIRSIIHRCAGVVLMLVSVVQLGYFIFARGGRKEVLALIPKWSDVTAFIKTMGYYLSLCKELPPAGRYDYTEKVEYLALIWGTLIMAATGIILWFPEYFLSLLPIWSFELSEVIHFFEAVLAVSAIVVWHLFFTVFHPKHYPMNTAWLHGKISKKEQEAHHSLEKLDDE